MKTKLIAMQTYGSLVKELIQSIHSDSSTIEHLFKEVGATLIMNELMEDQVKEMTPAEFKKMTRNELKKYIKDNKIKYGIMDVRTVLIRSHLFKNYFKLDKEKGVIQLKEIGGFKKIAEDTNRYSSFIIFEFYS